MNYVAHLYLTYPEKELSVGNLLGDLIGNNLLDELTELHREGVAIHRFIDSYTDGHEVLDDARAALRKRHRKYAPVVLDILLDFVLVSEWERYSDGSFDQFQEWVYTTIENQVTLVPQSAGIRLQHMANARWLNSYSHREGFQAVLNRMDRRARFESSFNEAMIDLEENWELFSNSLNDLLEVIQLEVNTRMDSAILRSEGKL